MLCCRTYKTCEMTDIVNLYFQSPSRPLSDCPSRVARIMRRVYVSSSLKQAGEHIIKVTPVRSHLRLLHSMSWTRVKGVGSGRELTAAELELDYF